MKSAHSLHSEAQESWQRWVTGASLRSLAAGAEGHGARHVMLCVPKVKRNWLLRSQYRTESSITLPGPEVERNISLRASEGSGEQGALTSESSPILVTTVVFPRSIPECTPE